MIRYADGEPLNYLPEIFHDADMKALSYAVKKAIGKALTYRVQIRLFADLDILSEEILALMALELGTQYYDRSLPIETKRDLIRNTLKWYSTAGTISAVQEMVDILFGYGIAIEWDKFEDGEGIPGEFEIITDMEIGDEAFKGLAEIIDRIKRLSAHLRSVKLRGAFEIGIDYSTEIAMLIDWGIREKRKYLDATWELDGAEQLNGVYGEAHDYTPVRQIGIAFEHKYSIDTAGTAVNALYLDGTWALDGEIALKGGKTEL